ncbi:MAG: hypothetical protein U0401_18305 [Anaerolineae bacterium]
MTKIHARFWGTLLLIVIFAFNTVSAAFAAAPTTVTYPLQGTASLADCDGFQVFDDYDITIVRTDFFDNDGNLTMMNMKIDGTDTYRHSVTGQSFTMGSHFMVRNDYKAGKFSAMGLQYHLTVPGVGQVLMDVGNLVYDPQVGDYVFFAGPHQVASGDTARLCTAFN